MEVDNLELSENRLECVKIEKSCENLPYDDGFSAMAYSDDENRFIHSGSTTSDNGLSPNRENGSIENGDFHIEEMENLQEEHDNLLSSLMALTTHFAQVQFRLHQISEAPETERDILLKKLEDFADRGVFNWTEQTSELDSKSILSNVDSQRSCQQELIDQLKTQLDDLEKYAYETGTNGGVPPQAVMVEKQKIIIDELKQKMNLNFDDLPQLSPAELRTQVDQAFGEFVSPLKMKEQLVAQLKTQVNDLERFIKFLQGGQDKKKFLKQQFPQNCERSTTTNTPNLPQLSISGKLYQVISKASTIFQIFALSQMGCASQNGNKFKKNTLKKTSRGNHWGDIRAKLEVDVQEILALVIETNEIAKNEQQLKKIPTCSKSDELKSLNIELITLVRKKFAVTLQKLIQHGLRSVNETKHMVPFISCFATLQMDNSTYADDITDYKEMHAWELILEYYHLKNGDYYNETPAQKLSQSFNLDMSGEGMVSNKQSFMYAVRDIINIHSPYKRSLNSHFKAFVCAGLNTHKLVQWLNLLFQSHELVGTYYTSWSYVAQTGFRDALKSIDQLTKYEFFDLPVDLAIRNLANIKDVFS
ncbi:unnamed protein product [Diamesa tonsa]